MLTQKLPHILAFILCCGTLPVPATVVELTNGDRISGELTRLDTERVLLTSPVLGEVVIEVSQVANSEVLPAIEIPEASAQTAVSEGTTTAAPPAAEAAAAVEPTARPWYAFWDYESPEKWQGEFVFGASRQSGNTEETDVTAEIKLEWEKSDKESFVWSGRYEYGREDQTLNTDEWKISQRYRHDIAERWFLQSLSSIESDEIAQVNWDIQQSFGLGYRAANTDRLKVELVPGVGVQYLDQPGNDGFFLSASFIETLEWIVIEERLTFDQSFEFYIDPTDTEIWDLVFEASLTTDLNEQWAMRLGFKYEYDNSVDTGVDEEDTETTASIIYKF